MEQPTSHIEAPEQAPEKTLGRRELLQALAAAGGAVTASSLLPGEWAKPVVEVGVLPAHAQISLTPTPSPSPPPVPVLVGIETCSASGGQSGSSLFLFPNDSIASYAVLDTPLVIGMRRTITAMLPENPLPQNLGQDDGQTDATGRIDSLPFPIGSFELPIGTIITVLYNFDDPRYPALDDPCTQTIMVSFGAN